MWKAVVFVLLVSDGRHRGLNDKGSTPLFKRRQESCYAGSNATDTSNVIVGAAS